MAMWFARTITYTEPKQFMKREDQLLIMNKKYSVAFCAGLTYRMRNLVISITRQ